MGSELSLPYVPIDPNIDSHPKTRRFLRAIGKANDPAAHAHLLMFLLAVGRHHVSGSLGVMDDADLADMGKWPGDAKVFAEALVSSGWLMIGVGGYVVVGWEDYGGRVLKKREQWKEQQRHRRASGGVRHVSGGHPAESGGVHDHKVKGEEVKGEGEVKSKTLARSASHSALVPVSAVAMIPLIGDKEHPVTTDDLVEWQGAFPAVDVPQALRSMRQWCLANPDRKKTARGVRAFIVRWLSREQDRGHQEHSPPSHLSKKGQDIAKALAGSDPNMFVFPKVTHG